MLLQLSALTHRNKREFKLPFPSRLPSVPAISPIPPTLSRTDKPSYTQSLQHPSSPGRSPGNGNSMLLRNVETKHTRCCKNPKYDHPSNCHVHLTSLRWKLFQFTTNPLKHACKMVAISSGMALPWLRQLVVGPS